jgi:hypothetical protein
MRALGNSGRRPDAAPEAKVHEAVGAESVRRYQRCSSQMTGLVEAMGDVLSASGISTGLAAGSAGLGATKTVRPFK